MKSTEPAIVLAYQELKDIIDRITSLPALKKIKAQALTLVVSPDVKEATLKIVNDRIHTLTGVK